MKNKSSSALRIGPCFSFRSAASFCSGAAVARHTARRHRLSSSTAAPTSRGTGRPGSAAMAAAAAPASSSSSPGWDFTCNFEVDYGSEEHASIVYKTLAVDKELQPDKVRREMTVSGGKLLVRFEAVEARFLRASFSAFVDLMVLITKLVEEYGVSKEEHS